MSTFGKTLRSFRQASNDPDRLNRRLTQERLGELIGDEMGDDGFTGAAVSEWELGKSKISAENRNVLIALIKVLHKTGSLHTDVEANTFLELGHYRTLNQGETQEIFGRLPNQFGAASVESYTRTDTSGPIWLAGIFSISQEEIDELISEAKEGPEPSWPRILAAVLRKISDRFSFSLNTVLWICVWLLAWGLIRPSLQLPYANQEVAFGALGMYAVGSIVLPLLIGLQVNTSDNEFWKAQRQIKPFLLRLYTYQGAGIGFNVGYFLAFPFVLVRYFLGFNPSGWLEMLAVTVSLIFGTMAARVVPHNLLRAYQRLAFKDGRIFFVVALAGIFWAVFFFQYYALLLTPGRGIWIILTAFTLAIFTVTRQAKKQAI